MQKIKIAELVLDYELYPRNNVDSHNVKSLVEARAAGVELPPIVIDKKSKRVVDGFHRVLAEKKFSGKDGEILAIEKTYKDEAAIFLDAMRYNATHGARLDPCDRTRCSIIAKRLHIPREAIAGALNMSVEKIGELLNTRVATSKESGLSVPLKRTVMHFAGKNLNKRQEEANTKLSGMNQQFYANQLIELIESKMLSLDDEELIGRLRHLHELLDDILATA